MADLRATLFELRNCFASWQPDVRVLGNVRAADAVLALDDVIAARPAQAGEVAALIADDGPIACAELHLRMTTLGCQDVDDGSLADGLRDARKLLQTYGDARAAAAASRPATAVPEDDGRAEFEKWAARRWGLSFNRWEDSGEYTSHLTHDWWQCWTESRKAMLSASPQPAAVHGTCSAHCAATGECTNACAPITPQPEAKAGADVETVARQLFESEQRNRRGDWTWDECSTIEREGWTELAQAAIAILCSAKPKPAEGDGDVA